MAKVPWAAIAHNPAHYFDDGQLPNAVVLREPSKLQADEVAALWNLWEGRQKAGRPGLVFHGALPKDSRIRPAPSRVRKRKAYVDLPSSEGEGVASDHEEDGVKDMRVNAGEDAREFGEGQGEGRENWVVNEADGGRDRVDQEEGGSEGVDQEEGDGGAKEDVDVENVEGESDHIEGEANHPTSPAYSSATAKS